MMREWAAGVHQLVSLFSIFIRKTKGNNNNNNKKEEVNDMSVHLLDALHTGSALFLILFPRKIKTTEITSRKKTSKRSRQKKNKKRKRSTLYFPGLGARTVTWPYRNYNLFYIVPYIYQRLMMQHTHLINTCWLVCVTAVALGRSSLAKVDVWE